MFRYLTAITLVLLLAAALGAQETGEQEAPSGSTPPAACSGVEHDQFDFWIGEWSVTQLDGSVAGENSIQPILNGCVLFEQWTGASGFTGKSFNMYDAASGEWHQTWVDGSGSRLDLTGGLDDADMVLRGERPSAQGGTVQHEIRWTPQDDGSVRQHWRSSADGGATWKDVFVGIYARSTPR